MNLHHLWWKYIQPGSAVHLERDNAKEKDLSPIRYRLIVGRNRMAAALSCAKQHWMWVAVALSFVGFLPDADAAITAPGQFTYWSDLALDGPAPFGAISWFDYEQGLLYRFGGSTFPLGYAVDKSLWRLNMTSLNPSGNFQPNWTLVASVITRTVVYPTNAGDPGTPQLWPGPRSHSPACIDKVSVPGDTLLWLYGGSSQNGDSSTSIFEDLWYFSVKNNTWRFMGGRKGNMYELENTGIIPEGLPGPRWMTSLTMNVEGTKLLLFGGDGPQFSDRIHPLNRARFYSVYEFSLLNRTWSQRPLPASIPSQWLLFHYTFSSGDFVYAATVTTFVQGQSAPVQGVYMVRYQISNNTWIRLTPSSGSIPARYAATVVHRDPRSRNVIIWGGFEFDYPYDIYRFNLDTEAWSNYYNFSAPTVLNPPIGVADPSTKPDYSAYCVAAIYKDRIFFHGGQPSSGGRRNSLFTYNIPCASGGYADDLGECQLCPPGTYEQNLRCKVCGVGFSSDQASTSCFACFKGFYGRLNAETGLPECKVCSAGTFTNQTNQLECSKCPAGTSATPGSSSCSPCSSGLFSNESTSGLCVPCPLGQITTADAVACELCGLGNTTRAPAQASCVACDSSNLYSNASTSSLCEICPRGWVATLDRGSCELCPAGTYHPTERSPFCVACPGGTTSTSGSTQCSACPTGRFSNSATQGLCQECQTGFITSPNQADCVAVAASNAPSGPIPSISSGSPAETTPKPSAPSIPPSTAPRTSASPPESSDSNNSGNAAPSNQAAVVAAIILGVLFGVSLITAAVVIINLKKKIGTLSASAGLMQSTT